MFNTLRWILVVPATLAATAGAYFGLVLVWNLVRVINIVPQDGLVDLALANLGVNGASSAAGVLAGTKTAPRHRRAAAIMVAILLGAVGLASLLVGAAFRDSLRMSLGWHVFSSIAWVVGAIAAALALSKQYERD